MSNENKLHYYGPAPTYSDDSGIIDGVLSCIVLQSNENTRPAFDENSGTYHCQVKGPTRVLQNCSHVIGLEIDDALNSFGLPVIQRMPHPNPGPMKKWVVTSINVDQIIAGEHSMVTFYCDTQNQSETGQQSAKVVKDDNDQWSLQWQSYTMKAVAFCSNDGKNNDPIYADSAPRPFNQQPVFPANRENIDYFLNGTDKGIIKENANAVPVYWFRDNNGNGFYLNQPETFIAKKAMQDKQALYHYPIITVTETYQTIWPNGIALSARELVDFPVDEKVGYLIDYLVTDELGQPEILPREDCPITLANPYSLAAGQWEWVKIDDSVNDTIKYNNDGYITAQTWTRTEKWQGMLSADPNYYGVIEINNDRSNLSAARWLPGIL